MDRKPERITAAIVGVLCLTSLVLMLTAGEKPQIRVSVREPAAETAVTAQITAPEKNGTEHSRKIQTEKTAGKTVPSADAKKEVKEEIESSVPDRNLNTADAAALKRVSGIGDFLADAILAYRDAHGGFRRRAELLEIDGIGPTLAERILNEFEIPGELPPEELPPEPEQHPEQQSEQQNEQVPVSEPEPEAARFALNAVTREELLRVPEMTEALADSILQMREKLGGYSSIYELMLIPEIKGSYFNEILRNYLYIEGDPVSSEP